MKLTFKPLFIVLFALLIPCGAWADVEIDGIYYNLNTKTKQAAVTNGGSTGQYSGDIFIPSTVQYEGVTYSVTSIGEYAFYGCTGLTSIAIPNSVTSIYKYAFDYCSGLTSVKISELAAWCNISFKYASSNPLRYAHHLFLNGEEVKDLVIPNSVTSIGIDAFNGCTGLTSVTIPNSVTSIGYSAFEGCSGLTSVTIPNSVTSIGYYAFNGCTGLTSIIIPNSVTSIGYYAFEGCSGLTKVCITDIGAWCSISFSGSYSNPLRYAKNLYLNDELVTSLSIPDSMTIIGNYTFYGCSGLTSVTIPNSVTRIGDLAFYGCNGLTSIEIPANVTRIGNRAFYGCNGLTSVICHALTPPKFTLSPNYEFLFITTVLKTAILYVPFQSLVLYENTWGKYFKNICCLPYKIFQCKMTRTNKQVHIKMCFSDERDDYYSLDEYVSLASKDETLKLLSFMKSGESYDLYFKLPKKEGTYTLKVANTLPYLDQNENGITGEDADTYTQDFLLGMNELYVVAQSPVTGVKGKAGYTDVVLNDVVEEMPISQFSLVSPSGKETAITKVDYLDNLTPARHRVYYDVLKEDGIYIFTIHKGLRSSKDWDMRYDYQSAIELPCADLSPINFTGLDKDWISGQKHFVTYQVKNKGTMPANGKSINVLYLSPTETWSNEAIEIYKDTVDVNMQSQESYTRTVDVTIPPCIDGRYYLILKTNVAHTINELSYDDNTLVSDALSMSVEWLTEANNQFTLERGKSRLFKIPVTSDKNIEIVDKYGKANMNIGYYAQPNIDEESKNGSIIILSPDSSMVYYLLISNNGKNTTMTQPCELNIRQFDIDIASVGRDKIVKDKTAWIPIEVKGCTEMPVFYLMDAQGKKTMNKDVYVKTETMFYAQFDTEALQVGKYSIYVECGENTGMMPNVVTISNEVANPNVDAKLVLPKTSRIGSTITAYIDFQNTGNVDIPAPLFILTGEKGSIYTLDGHGSETEEAHIMGVNEKGILSTLLPGESNRISVNIKIPNEHILYANYNLKTLTEGCDGIDEPFYLQWLDVNPDEKPTCYTNEEWRAYCTRLRNNVGDTWQTFIQALGKAADMYFTTDFVEHDAHFLYSILKEVDLNALDSDIASNQVNKKRASNKDDGDEPGSIFLYDGKNEKWLPLVEAICDTTYTIVYLQEGVYEKQRIISFVEWKQTEHCSKLNSGNYFFISHGMDNNHHEGWISEMAKVLNKKCNGQIICVCWGKLSSEKSWSQYIIPKIPPGIYPWQAASHINKVVKLTHNALNVAFNGNPEKDISLSNFHFIGHSHGSHVCGRLANSYPIGPKRLTALDESEEIDHWYKENYNRGGRYKADYVDYYKSSVISGTEFLVGDDNFILANEDGQFKKIVNEGERHGYAYKWFTETIEEDKGLGYYWDRSKHKKIKDYGRKGNSKAKGWSGVINGPKKIIEDYSKYYIQNIDWNYPTPWYTPKDEKKPNQWDFRKALASTIDYSPVSIDPYYDGNDYIESGTTENVKVRFKNSADNFTIPLNVREYEVRKYVANALFITNSNNSKDYYIDKNKDSISKVRTEVPLYILGCDNSYGNISRDGSNETEANISFTISTDLWNRLAGEDKNKEYIYCDLWFISGSDQFDLKLGWANIYAGSYGTFLVWKKDPLKVVQLWKGELYPKNNVIIKEKVKVKNPTLACNAGNDMTYTLGKGQKTVNVTVNGVVERDNGMDLSYNWEKGDFVFSNSNTGNLQLGVGSHTLTFHIKDSNANEASDDINITVKPYTPGDEDEEKTSTLSSWDPNEKVGIRGAGGKSCVRQGETMEYAIYFENDSTKAQLAAQTVTVVDTLDTAFDLSTFEFTGSEVANTYIDIPSGKAETTVYTDLRPNNDLILKSEMKMDIDNRVLTVVYSSLDTLTYEPTQDVFAGFLPPNDSTHVGEGHFSYRVKLKDDVADGYVVRNQAHIFFDYNDEIATNTTSHIVDNRVPISNVEGLPPITMEDSVLVSWSGLDEGAGIKYYDIYRSKNGGEYELWLSHVLDNSAIQYGTVGDVYRYYSIATDSLGFVEAMKTHPEATVKFTNADGITLIEKGQVAIDYDGSAFVITGAEGGECDVYDLAGQLMANKKRLARQDRMAFSKKGVYVVNVETADGVTYAKKMALK